MVTLVTGSVLAGDAPTAPATRRADVVDQIHGSAVADPYRWLESEAQPEVQTWLADQRTYAQKMLGGFKQRQDLARRFKKLFSVTKLSCPVVYGDRYLFTKHEGLANHAVHFVREGSHQGQAKAIIDPNGWSDDGTVALDWKHPTPDASLIAYGRSASGSEKSTLYVLDVATGKHLPDQIPHTRYCSLAWDPDGRGFIYTRYPEPGTVPTGEENYHRKLYHHRLGSDWRDDRLVIGDLAQKEELLDVAESSDHKYVFLSRTVDWAKNDLYFHPLGSDESFKPIAVGLDGQVSADVLGDRLFILTNVGAARYRLATAPIARPTPEHWKDVIPEQKGVIKAFEIVGGKIVVAMVEDVHSRLLVYEPDGRLVDEIALPTMGTVGTVNSQPDRPELFFSFQSFAHPPSNFRYDLAGKKLEMFEQTEAGIDLSQYEAQQVWYKSKDGTRVPMFVVHRKGLKRDGNNPTVLYGYGGFDIGLYPRFDVRKIPWLDAGGVYVIANLRGGGEFGKSWHEAGRLGKKQNVFDDYVAAAEELIKLGYTSSKRLAIFGGSNGGLLVGAAMTQRPDLFRAVVCAVPLLDMIRYHNFQIARLWIPEYGSAEDAEQFKWLYAYSPYHRVQAGVTYPSTLLMTAESDSRVEPMHAYKMAAALQAANADRPDRPILLRVEAKAGHGAGMPLSKRIDEQVDLWTYLLWQLQVLDR
ncbi:MAG: S9 family peptidase [bacterium]|nr:S9 family peptidase [bacterium]